MRLLRIILLTLLVAPLLLWSSLSWAERKFIIIGIGPTSDPGSAEQVGCSRDHSEGCDLYKCQFDTDRGVTVGCDKIVTHEDSPDWFPSVDPSGRWVAYNTEDEDGVQLVHVYDLVKKLDSPVSSNVRFPNFGPSHEELFATVIHPKENGYKPKDIYKYSLQYDSSGLIIGMNRELLLSHDNDFNYSDSSQSRSDPNLFTVMKTNLNAGEGECSADVTVEAMSNGRQRSYELDLPEGIDCCGHSVINNKTVLCSSNDHKVYRFQFQSLITERIPTSFRSLREGRIADEPLLVAGKYISPDGRPMWPHKSVKELSEINPKYDPSICESLLHAYVDWCGSDDLIAVSIMCGRSDEADGHDDSSYGTETEYSRVFLIDTSDPENPQYHDVLQGFEELEGEAMESVTATCFTSSVRYPEMAPFQFGVKPRGMLKDVTLPALPMIRN